MGTKRREMNTRIGRGWVTRNILDKFNVYSRATYPDILDEREAEERKREAERALRAKEAA